MITTTTPINKRIEFADIPGQVSHYRVLLPDESNRLVGYVLITHEGNEAIIWNIYVEPKYRKKGLASYLISAIKSRFNYIITSYTSEHGKRLCIKNGFSYDEKTNFLEWNKNESASS